MVLVDDKKYDDFFNAFNMLLKQIDGPDSHNLFRNSISSFATQLSEKVLVQLLDRAAAAGVELKLSEFNRLLMAWSNLNRHDRFEELLTEMNSRGIPYDTRPTT